MDNPIYDYLMTCLENRTCSVRELSEMSGVPYFTLSKIVQGQRIPRIDTVDRILSCFPPMPARKTPSRQNSARPR